MSKKTGPYQGLVVLVADTFISGAHVPTGTVIAVNPSDYSLLREANRCEIYEPDNEAHQACLAATRKVEAARKEAEAKAQKAAEDQEEPEGSPEARLAAAKIGKTAGDIGKDAGKGPPDKK